MCKYSLKNNIIKQFKPIKIYSFIAYYPMFMHLLGY